MTTETVEVRAEIVAHEPSPVSDVALWTCVALGPLVFLLNLEVNYAIVDWACNTGNTWAVHVAHLASLVVTAFGVLLGIVLWRRTGGGWPDAEGGAVPRSRLLAAVGTFGNVLFGISLIAHWIPVWILGSCLRA